MDDVGTPLTAEVLRAERARLRRPAMCWLLVTVLFAVPLALESAYALSGSDRYLSATGTVEPDPDPASDSGLQLAWRGEDGEDTYPLVAFEVDELDLQPGDRVPVRYQSGSDGAYLPEVEDADPETLARPGSPGTWLPPLLAGLLTAWLLTRGRRRRARLQQALTPDAPSTRTGAAWLAVGRTGAALLELTPPSGPRVHAVGPAGCVDAADLPPELVLLGRPQRGDLLLTPGADGVRLLGRWCRPWPRLLATAVPLRAGLLKRRFVPASARVLLSLGLLGLSAAVGFASAGGGHPAAVALAVALVLGVTGAHVCRQQLRLDDAGVQLRDWPDRTRQLPWADVAGLEVQGRQASLLLCDGARVRVRLLDRPGRLATRRVRAAQEQHLADVRRVVARAARGAVLA